MSDPKDQQQTGPGGVVRMSVNLAPDVAQALRETATRQGVTLTEGVRRAIAVWRLIHHEIAQGNRVYIEDPQRSKATRRELVLL